MASPSETKHAEKLGCSMRYNAQQAEHGHRHDSCDLGGYSEKELLSVIMIQRGNIPELGGFHTYLCNESELTPVAQALATNDVLKLFSLLARSGWATEERAW